MNITAEMELTPHLQTSKIRPRRVLAAIDTSGDSQHVLDAAAHIAHAFGSEPLVASATTPNVYATGIDPIPVDTFDLSLNLCRSSIHELISRSSSIDGLKLREYVAYADPVDLVAQIVKQERVELLILGSHGARGIERLIVGSIAESILRRISCPAIIVGPKCIPSPNPFRSILLATDLETTGLRPAQYASSLAERFHGRLTLLHVAPPEASGRNPERTFSEEQARQRLLQILPSNINDYAREEIRIEYGNPNDLITSVASSENASLIVVGVREGGVLPQHSPWSTLSHVIREAPCPVMAVRRTFH